MMRKTYLKEHRPAMYSLYMLEDRLTEHLNAVDNEAQERMGILVRQMMEKQGVTEELKARDQMEWVRAVNNIRNAAEEIVLKELVYICFWSCNLFVFLLCAFSHISHLSFSYYLYKCV